MTRYALFAAALLGLVASPVAGAWGALGHRLVGRLAEQDLTPAARREVARLLAGEPVPTLAGVSAWADELRASDPGLGRQSTPWHYVNLGEDACRFDAARDCPGGDCVVGAIQAQVAVLRDHARPLEERRRALKFVVHFVGDIHQPLHAGYAHDKGGSTHQLRVPTPSGEKGSNLHSWWDSGMLAATGFDEDAHFARLQALPLVVPLDAMRPSPAASRWAMDACAIATSPGLYPGGSRLAADYAARWMPVADAQLRRAGSRLAQVLNAALAR